MKNTIICIGEVLWDSLPGGLFLGGAPHGLAAIESMATALE